MIVCLFSFGNIKRILIISGFIIFGIGGIENICPICHLKQSLFHILVGFIVLCFRIADIGFAVVFVGYSGFSVKRIASGFFELFIEFFFDSESCGNGAGFVFVHFDSDISLHTTGKHQTDGKRGKGQREDFLLHVFLRLDRIFRRSDARRHRPCIGLVQDQPL